VKDGSCMCLLYVLPLKQYEIFCTPGQYRVRINRRKMVNMM